MILHLFSGRRCPRSGRCDVRMAVKVITLDISTNVAENLHNAAIWSHLWDLASRSKLLAILGGPPCRSLSRIAKGKNNEVSLGWDISCLPSTFCQCGSSRPAPTTRLVFGIQVSMEFHEVLVCLDLCDLCSYSSGRTPWSTSHLVSMRFGSRRL